MSGVFDVNSAAYLGAVPPSVVFPQLSELTRDDIEQNTLLPLRRLQPVKEFRVQFARNWTPMPDSIAGSVRDTDKVLTERLSNEYQQKEEKNVALASNPDAITLTVPTLLVNEVDAIAEGQRRLAFTGQSRNVYELDAFAIPFTMELMQQITIEYPRYFEGGAPAIIVRIVDELQTQRSSLEVVA